MELFLFERSSKAAEWERLRLTDFISIPHITCILIYSPLPLTDRRLSLCKTLTLDVVNKDDFRGKIALVVAPHANLNKLAAILFYHRKPSYAF